MKTERELELEAMAELCQRMRELAAENRCITITAIQAEPRYTRARLEAPPITIIDYIDILRPINKKLTET